MNERNESIAAGLRKVRAGAKESQRELAESVGVNPSTMSAWENLGCFGFDDAWRIADHYGVSLDELAGRVFPNR